MKTTTLLAIVAAATLGYASPVPEQQAEAGEAGEAGTAEKACGTGGCGGGGWGYPPPPPPPPPPSWGGWGPPPPVFPPAFPPPPPPCAEPWCAGLPPPPPEMRAWPDKFPEGSPFNDGGLQQAGNTCSTNAQAVSCCNGDTDNSGTLGVLDSGNCGFNLLGNQCKQNVACCPTDGGGFITVGGLCQLLNL